MCVRAAQCLQLSGIGGNLLTNQAHIILSEEIPNGDVSKLNILEE